MCRLAIRAFLRLKQRLDEASYHADKFSRAAFPGMDGRANDALLTGIRFAPPSASRGLPLRTSLRFFFLRVLFAARPPLE